MPLILIPRRLFDNAGAVGGASGLDGVTVVGDGDDVIGEERFPEVIRSMSDRLPLPLPPPLSRGRFAGWVSSSILILEDGPIRENKPRDAPSSGSPSKGGCASTTPSLARLCPVDEVMRSIRDLGVFEGVPFAFVVESSRSPLMGSALVLAAPATLRTRGEGLTFRAGA